MKPILISIFALYMICVSACSTVRVDTNCLHDVENDIDRLKHQHEHKDLDDAEFIEALNSELGLIDSMKFANKIFKAGQHNYCEADFNQARWNIQEEINFTLALQGFKKK